MKVRELIQYLEEQDPNAIVVLSSDEEGNSYSPLENFSISKYNADTKQISLVRLTERHKELGYSEEDVMEDGELALVLYP